MRPSVGSLLPLLLPALALGQTSSLDRADPFRGTQLPPTSAALADEAFATGVNPAGLSAVGASQLFYVHERSIARNQVADGLYLASTLFGFGGGFSVDWIRSSTLPGYRRTGWGLSIGSPTRLLALGASFNFFSSDDDPALDGMSSIDLGLLTRPAEFLSFGAVVKNLDQPTRRGLTFDRRYDFGVGLRPFGERVTLGLDYVVDEPAGFAAGRVNWTLQAQVLHGLRLGAGLAHGLRAFEPQVQVALTLDTSYLGFTYAGGSSPAGADHVMALRVSIQKYPELSLATGKLALVDLDDRLADGGALSLVGFGTEEDPYLRLTRFLDAAARDKDLQGLILKIDTLPGLGLGRAEELRQTILRMRAAGKKVVAVVLSAGDTEYLLASAADRIYATPRSSFLVNGFAAHPTFFGGTMGKLGVKWEAARVGAYKTAPDELTRTASSPEERETLQAYLATNVRQFKAALEQGRGLPPARVDAIWKEGLLSAQRARESGLVDEVLGPQQIDEQLEKLLPSAIYDERYDPRGTREARWSERKRIAIIPVIGTIAGGKSRQAPLGGAVAGAETVMRALERARQDPRVAAIVVRVDSGGGEGLAADLMYRAMLEAKQRKPVVASLGNTAASGGYYVAMGANEILASPHTVTGSIGVFLLKPAVRELADKLGVTRESIKTAPLADLMDQFEPWTPEEQAVARRWVESFYDGFISEVATSRGMNKASVDAVARGRVWSGEDARARGLVDTLGGLSEAIDAARRRAGLTDEEVELVVYGEPHGLLSAPGGEEGVEGTALGGLLDSALGEGGILHGVLLNARARQALPPGLSELAAELGLRAGLLNAPRVMAMMPFSLKVD